jgi:hypothetical protein
MGHTRLASLTKRTSILALAFVGALMALPAAGFAPTGMGQSGDTSGAPPRPAPEFTLLFVRPIDTTAELPQVRVPDDGTRYTIITVDPKVFESASFCTPTPGSRGEWDEELIAECLRILEERGAAQGVPEPERHFCRLTAGARSSAGSVECLPAP